MPCFIQFINSVQLDSLCVGSVKGVSGWGGVLRVLLPPMRVVTTLALANGNHSHHCG